MGDKHIEKNNTRKIHYDLLRIMAAFSVVMLHSAAQFWYDLDIRSGEWIVANSYDAVFRFGVPIFVMISGALFLDKDYQLDTKRLYTHNIFRLGVLYVVWSCIYGLIDCGQMGFGHLTVKEILREMLSGRYHLWFLPMILGIYVLLPILKSWVAHTEKKTLQYFLILFFVLQIWSETIRAFTRTDELHTILDLAKAELVCGYIGYFIWGYYIANVGIGEKLYKAIKVLFVPAILMNVVLGNLLAWRAGTPTGAIYDSFGLFTFIIVTGLFAGAVTRGKDVSVSEKSARRIKAISAGTFGVYVMHLGLMEWTEPLGIHSMMIPNILGIPVYAVLCFVISLLVATIIRRIPVIGRYLC